MLFYFKKDKSSCLIVYKRCTICGQSVIADDTVRKWFGKLSTNFRLEDDARFGRPLSAKEELLKEAMVENLHCSVCKML